MLILSVVLLRVFSGARGEKWRCYKGGFVGSIWSSFEVTVGAISSFSPPHNPFPSAPATPKPRYACAAYCCARPALDGRLHGNNQRVATRCAAMRASGLTTARVRLRLTLVGIAQRRQHLIVVANHSPPLVVATQRLRE